MLLHGSKHTGVMKPERKPPLFSFARGGPALDEGMPGAKPQMWRGGAEVEQGPGLEGETEEEEEENEAEEDAWVRVERIEKRVVERSGND